MKKSSCPATFETHEVTLPDENKELRVYGLKVVLFGEEKKSGAFYLFDYYGWLVSWDKKSQMNAAIEYLKQEYPGVIFPI